MAPECHALLKGVCAIKGKSVSEYCYEVLAKEFELLVRTDEQVKQLFMAGQYPPGGRAYELKKSLLQEEGFE